MYIGICSEAGTVIAEEDAFDYALGRISAGTDEEKKEFADWFYSGNFIKEDEHGRDHEC